MSDLESRAYIDFDVLFPQKPPLPDKKIVGSS